MLNHFEAITKNTFVPNRGLPYYNKYKPGVLHECQKNEITSIILYQIKKKIEVEIEYI